MSKSLATQAPAGLPALANTPALDIGGDDVNVKRLYLAMASTTAVQAELVKPGAIFVADNKDDPNPEVLAEKGDETGVLIHVLSLTKKRSAEVNGELQSYAFNDPDAPANSYVTYNYVLALPEYDTISPVKWLLKGSGTSAAKQINTVIMRATGQVPACDIAFRVTTKFRENEKGKWYVPVVRVVEAAGKNVAVARDLSNLVAGSQQVQAAVAADDDAPAI